VGISDLPLTVSKIVVKIVINEKAEPAGKLFATALKYFAFL
jgi:hypothetical protein